MAQQLDKYILNNYNEGKTASDMYTYQQPKKQISNDAINYLEKLDSTPMKAYSPRNYDLTPTTDVENTRKAFSDVYDQVLNIYGSSTSGKAIRGDYRFAVDAAIATALGKDYSEVAKNHKYYVRAITGTDMEDEGWMKAFADNWTTYWYNRELSWKQLHFDWTQDEETKLQLQKDMTELEQKIIKKSDYRDRNLLAKSAVASAPIVNQVVESLVLTYAGAAIGGAIAGAVGGTLSGSKAFGTIATALSQNQEFFGALKTTQGIAKGAIAGRNIGILANVANTFTMETGSLSRELYNELDENGNRMSDTSRKAWSAMGGAVNTILEYMTPDPVVGMAKLGKFPLDEAKGSVREWIIAYGINRFKDANSESMEEMFQAMAGDIVKTIAKTWANEKQGTNYDIGRIEELVNDTLQDGWESYKETFMPVLVSSFIPGTYKDLQTLSASIDNGVRAQYAIRNSEKGLKEAWKYQQENTNPNVIGMDFISQGFGKVKGDYSNGKLGKINVKENPNNKSMYVGATELDADKLHWLYNKGIKAVDVNIVEQVAPSMDKHSFSNLGKAFGGSFDSSTNILTIRNDKSLESFKKYMADMGFDIKENGNAFSITDTDTKATFTVQLATPQTAQTVQNNVDRKSVV